MIGDLETTLTNNQTKTNKRKVNAKSSLIPSLKEFEENEATEEKQKKKPRSEKEGTDNSSKKVQKHWDSAEAALLLLLLTGSSPIGRNVSGILIK
jgi:hypothetical protein